MKCKQCGQELGEGVRRCPICKTEQEIRENQAFYIGYKALNDTGQYHNSVAKEVYPYVPRSRVIAGILQILLGGLGIGRFYLGYNHIAIAQLFTFPIFFIGGIWGFIDGILILCGQIDCDVNGVPLK